MTKINITAKSGMDDIINDFTKLWAAKLGTRQLQNGLGFIHHDDQLKAISGTRTS